MRRTAAGVFVAAVLTLATAGTANAADVYNCPDFTYQEDAQAVYDQDTSDPNGLDGEDNDGQACKSLPRRGSAAAPAASTGTTSSSAAGTGTTGSSQVSTRPAGAVAAGDGSASESSSVLQFVLGGAALAAAGGAGVAARRSSRASA